MAGSDDMFGMIGETLLLRPRRADELNPRLF